MVAGRLVRTPRSKRPETRREYDAQVETTASDLIARVVLPGEWFLVRFGGTRKGSGTFYTRPQLAVPTVQRTLRPLAYNPPLTSHGQPDETIPATDWIPKPPEEILRLKVCDQGMGSGSFVIATLRFLTEALLESLYEHGRIQRQEDQILITLAAGEASGGQLNEEYLKCRPDDEDFESLLRAQLKRYIVERCLYGVDLDPLAVELARLAVWIETMDKALPFEFLDHKLKVGNALVQALGDEHRFFHWELEFPDVFAAPGNGFDAVVGNPRGRSRSPIPRSFSRTLTPSIGRMESRRPSRNNGNTSSVTSRMNATGSRTMRASRRLRIGTSMPLSHLATESRAARGFLSDQEVTACMRAGGSAVSAVKAMLTPTIHLGY